MVVTRGKADYSRYWYTMSPPIVVNIIGDLDVLETNDIRLSLLKNDLRHLISQSAMKCINFRKGIDFRSYRSATLKVLKLAKIRFERKIGISSDGEP